MRRTPKYVKGVDFILSKMAADSLKEWEPVYERGHYSSDVYPNPNLKSILFPPPKKK